MIEKIMRVIRSLWLHIKLGKRLKTNGFQNIRMGNEVIVGNQGSLYLGNGVTALQRVTLSVYGGHMSIGDHVGINRNCMFVCRDKISIGDRCAFGPNVVIFDHDHLFDETGYQMDQIITSPVEIGSKCWIGANVTILRGAIIGEGSIIGAGTLVKGIIPPYSLVTSDRVVKIRELKRKNGVPKG